MDAIKSLPGYEVLQCIAEGDVATVWLARQLALDRLVAIKVLNPAGVGDPETRQQFQSEARIAARINHPGIVQVYDAGEFAGLVYFIMEYVPGCTVADLLKQGRPLSERNALLIAQGCALALEYAWNEAQLIHCDVKPDNILIAEDGSVKVADLGLARFMGVAASPDMIEGTPHYCSPEQARGETVLDCRADIYSLGATLYHLVTGRVPFGGSEYLDVLRRQIEDHLPDPMDVNTALSPATAWLIEKMMIKDRTLRYAQWSAVLGDIERALAQQLPASPPPAPGQSTVLRSERRIWPSDSHPAQPPTPKATGSNFVVTPEQPTSPVGEKRQKAKKIVVSADFRPETARSDERESPVEIAREWLYLFAAAITAIVVYSALGIFYTLTPTLEVLTPENKSADRPAVEDVRTRSDSPLSRGSTLRPANAQERRTLLTGALPAPHSPRIALAPKSAEPASQPSSTVNHTRWSNPDFVRGAQQFNAALEQYKKYQRTRADPQILATAEKQCRDALAAFEAVRADAPPEIQIAELVRQCYQLIANIRQCTLLRSDNSPRAAISPIGQDRTSGGIFSDQTAAKEIDNLILAPSWNGPQPDASEKVLRDFARILRPVTEPALDLTADTSIVIFGQVFYMMPVREAARIMGKPQGIRRRLNTAGFPKDSFFLYSYSGEFGGDFDTMTLVTDSGDRIVAVQVSNGGSPDETWLDPSSFKEEWSIYDFVEGRAKGNPKWKIAHRVEKKNRVVRIDTELVTRDPKGYFELGASKHRAALYLPEPIANLIRLRVEDLLRSGTSHPSG